MTDNTTVDPSSLPGVDEVMALADAYADEDVGYRDGRRETLREAVTRLAAEGREARMLLEEAQAHHLACIKDLYRILGIDGEDGEYRYKWVALELSQRLAAGAERWIPIESAPQTPEDGAALTVLLGFAPDEEGYSPSTREGFWSPSLKRWSSSLDPGWTSSPQPTHWRPLPKPPGESE